MNEYERLLAEGSIVSSEIETEGNSGAQDFLPLSLTTTLVLASLLRSPKHGYGILKDIEVSTKGQFRIATGNMYTELSGDARNGLIEPFEAESDKRRKSYQITELGIQVLVAERRRLQMLTDFIDSSMPI